ncbi:hypothetical protein [Pseudomonas kulmbachensis]|uniref:hypothetical protein n=1 Tax=Pseudomonas kulmbachensis TaxID=3043408 RepID=UPI002AB2C15C|nr:hypothetical protein [Pseudomonas sp. V3/3/4/13]
MSKLSLKKLAVVMSLVCLPAAASFATTLTVGVGQEKTFSLTCKSGNFVGVAQGKVGNHFQTGKWAHVTSYKITRLNGQSGGNKANVNLYASPAPNFGRSEHRDPSKDSMIQDGKLHNVLLKRSNMGLVSSKKGELYVEFVFDKSGPDPRCATSSVYF